MDTKDRHEGHAGPAGESRGQGSGRVFREPFHYLLIVDYTARLFRTGKATLSAELVGIFERLGTAADNWQARMEKLKKSRRFGRFFAASQANLQRAATHLGMHRIANLAGCPAC
jgi:hypothetical protein